MDNKLFKPTIDACAAGIIALNSAKTSAIGVKDSEDILSLCDEAIEHCTRLTGCCNDKSSYAQEEARVTADVCRAASAACGKSAIKACKDAVVDINKCETACKKLGLQ